MTALVLVLALFIVSCDRFEHAFSPVVTVDIETELFAPLQEAFSVITPTDVSAVMAFYDADYLHNNLLKAEREAFYLGLFQQNSNLTFAVDILAQQTIGISDTLSQVTWRLVVTNAAKQIVADSTFSGEKVIKRGSTWLLYGNRDTCCPPITYKQRVIIEYFTGKFCTNCPQVSAILHQLQETYPNKMSYLSYHISDPMDIGNYDVYSYYGTPPQPSVVFQGENKIIGDNDTNEQIYNQLIQQISNTDSKIDMTNLNYSITGQMLSGTVRLTKLDMALNINQLNLKYAILDRQSATHTYVPSGAPIHNVVLAKGTKPLNGADLSQPISFDLPFNGTLPTDSYLVIWVQVTPDPFDSNATIYNGLESYIPVNKHHSQR
jgi:thiol-disulfide isomerase/thioredoxin